MNDMNNGNYTNEQNQQLPQYPTVQQVQPVPPTQKPPKKHKSHTTAKVAAILAGVIIVGGGAGFGGAYLANRTRVPTAETSTTSVTNDNNNTSKDETPTLDNLQKDVAVPQHNLTSDVEYNTDGTYMYTRDLVNSVRDSIVYIETYVNYRGQNTKYAAGSGIIISKDGYIVNNNHVVEKCTAFTVKVNTTDISTGISESKTYDAKLVGTDSDTDLAVLKIDAENLSAAKLGDSDELHLGDDVIAIGNPLGYETSVSKGIVSGLHRQVSDSQRGLTSIQTDAAINSGNSGGALFNTYGEVVGVVNEKRVDSYAENMGFAITINEAKGVIDDRIDTGYVSGRAMLGITYVKLNETAAAYRGMTPGWYVTEVNSDMAVAKSGLLVGDTITQIDGKSVFDSDIQKVFTEKKPGDTVTVTVVRTNSLGIDKNVDLKVELSEYKGN